MPSTLLLVDDSVTIQRVIELTFAHEDVRVVSMSDGHRALGWLETEIPDIVLADIGVPGVDGYGLATHIRSSARMTHVPILLLAGAFEPVDRARVQQAGCDGVLIKPFEPQRLVTLVKDLLAKPRAAHAPSRFQTGFGAVGSTPEPLEPPSRPVWEVTPTSTVQARVAAAVPTPAATLSSTGGASVSLVSAFTALLAAEQSTQPSPPVSTASAITEATVEDAVRRVLARMTDELVRRLVLETAERLIREEIDKIKANPD